MTEAPVYECISPEELVELASGEVAVERLEELLDHVDDCEECAGIVATVVQLKAHREEAMEILRRAKTWKEERERCSDR